MITGRMSYDEMAQHLLNDYYEVSVNDFKNKAKLRAELSRVKKFPANLSSHHFKSKNHNDWYLIYRATSKDIDDIMTFEVCMFRTKKGMNAAILGSNDKGKVIVAFYCAHFFIRYKERLNKKEDIQKLMIKYFRANPSSTTHTYEPPGGSKHGKILVESITKEGIALGQVTENENIINQTFKTFDMAFKNEEERFEYMRERLIKFDDYLEIE